MQQHNFDAQSFYSKLQTYLRHKDYYRPTVLMPCAKYTHDSDDATPLAAWYYLLEDVAEKIDMEALMFAGKTFTHKYFVQLINIYINGDENEKHLVETQKLTKSFLLGKTQALTH